jgi:pyridoxamine 5'-phosphate oxidase
MSGESPVDQFEAWLAEARAAGEPEADAMALATATAAGRPSVRYVLYRGMSGGGLRFFTNRESRKAGELDGNPYAAVVLYWPRLGRQVRFEGRVERLDDAESDAYFASRPRGHRLAAWASPQSRPLAHAELTRRRDELERRHAGSEVVPRPPFWGGYRLVPDAVELWQRGDDRLHRRQLWTRVGDAWQSQELAP